MPKKAKLNEKLASMMDDDEFIQLQVEMYGEKQLRRLQHMDSSGSLGQTIHSESKFNTESTTMAVVIASGNKSDSGSSDKDDQVGMDIDIDC